jgi:hypothetical protein
MVASGADTVQLRMIFRGPDGQPTDTDSLPTVSIIQPGGGVLLAPTSNGVVRTNIGEYVFNFTLSIHPPIGVWRDVWSGVVEGFTVYGEGTFQVNTTQLPAINSDGYAHLGDDPGYCFSQNAICNINNLLKSLKARVKNNGKKRATDQYGNVVYKDCKVFNEDELVAFLCQSLTMFNEIPVFTMFTFEDTHIIQLFHDVLVQGATYLALGAQAIIERGREFQIQDNGIGLTPPSVADILNGQYQTELANHFEKVKYIKQNMRGVIGSGTITGFAGASPQFRRLRWLRARQIY